MALPKLYNYYTEGGISSGLSADQPYFTLNNRNITIYSGAMHYFRVPQEYWRDRLRKMRAAGLNAVETYVPWNLHEPEPGRFDFGDGGSDYQELLDVEKFLKIAQEEDLLAIVRPGPYICAEYEFGGLPSWLLREKGIRMRTSDEVFLGYVERFFKALLSILVALQFTSGGPIIMFQIENEYGHVGKPIDTAYLLRLKEIMEENGIVELLFTSDSPSNGFAGRIPGVFFTANFNTHIDEYLELLQKLQPDKPMFVSEFYPGWFDHWTEKHHTTTNEDFAAAYEQVLKYNASINLYMFHGGSDWGFLNGANFADDSTDNSGLLPDTSSYDYDAPLTEAGDITVKYKTVARLLFEYNPIKTLIPDEPIAKKKVKYADVNLIGKLSIDALLEQSEVSIQSEGLVSMENLDINNNAGQSYGYVVYRKKNLDIPSDAVLKIIGHVCDTVMVQVNGELFSPIYEKSDDLDGFGYWRLENSSLTITGNGFQNATLDLIVENFGRGNFGHLDQLNQFKGLWQGEVYLNDIVIKDWEITPFEFKKKWTTSLTDWSRPSLTTGPALYRGVLTVTDEVTDTFVDMSEWTKGIVIVNGFVLSRHFKAGPQLSAYLPAAFLKEGDNEILIFEHFTPSAVVKFSDEPIFGNL